MKEFISKMKEWLDQEVYDADLDFEYESTYLPNKNKKDDILMEMTTINKQTLSGNTLLAVGKRFGHNNEQKKLQVESEMKVVLSEYPYPTFVEIRKGKWIGQKRF